MMKFSDKALKLIGRKLLSSMEASSDQDSSMPASGNSRAVHERARSFTLRAKRDQKKARVLAFRSNGGDD